MNDELKAVRNLGTELGAVKAENDRLREQVKVLQSDANSWQSGYDKGRHDGARHRKSEVQQLRGLLRQATELIKEQDARLDVDMLPAGRALMKDIRAALSQQAEPVCPFCGEPSDHCNQSFPHPSKPAPAQDEQQPKEEIPKPDGWVAAGRFFTDRGEAIAAAEKTPCVDVYLRPSLLTILARSAERQSVAEELARLLSQANCDIRQLNAAAPIAQTALQPEQSRPANKLRALAEIWDQNADEADEFGNAQAAEALRLAAFELRATLSAPLGKFRMGDLVKKSTGSEWVGRVCGWYSTNQTPEGYAVESEAHAGSVQIYPAKALEAVE